MKPLISNQNFELTLARLARRLMIIALLIFLHLYRRYFNMIDFSGFIGYGGWMIFELVDYFLVFIVWLWLFIFYSLLNWVYVYLLEQTFNITLNKRDPAARRFFDFYNQYYKDQINKDLKPTFELNGYFYNWICDPSNPERTKQFAKLFQTKVNRKLWKQQYMFFYKLFRLTYFCKLIDNSFTIAKGNVWNIWDAKGPVLLNSLKLQENFTLPLLWNFAKQPNFNDNLQIMQPAPRPLSTLFLQSYAARATKHSMFGTFYLANGSFQDVLTLTNAQTGLLQFEHILRTQINTAKWNRWLYRYSTLHRRVLKNSHKLTVTKRLFQSGFYDRQLVARNPWFTHRAPKLKKSLSTHMNTLFYSEFFTPKLPTSWSRLVSPLDTRLSHHDLAAQLSHYETSFFWFLKRFYSFNTIRTNQVCSTLNYELNPLLNFLALETSPLYNNTFSRLASLPNLANFDFSFEGFNHSYEYWTTVESASSTYSAKDPFLLFEEHDLLSLETTDLLYWIISPAGDASQRPLIFCPDYRSYFANSAKSSPLQENLINTPSCRFMYLSNRNLYKHLSNDIINWTYFL